MGEFADLEEAGVKPELGKKELLPTASNSGIGTAGFFFLLRTFPHLIIAPAILFSLIVALCSFGIVYATHESYNLEGKQARDAALSAADGLKEQLLSASRAALSLAALVKMNPSWPFLDSNFHAFSEELFRQSNGAGAEDDAYKLMEATLLPFGRVRADLGKPIQRNSTADIFSPPFSDLFNTMEVFERHSSLHIQGPFPLINSNELAFSAGVPVFFPDTNEDESWGHPDNITHPTGCPGPPCYNPETREKYWGSAGALVNAGPIFSGDIVHLKRLLSDDLSFKLELSRPDDTSGVSAFVTGGSNPDKVTANVTVALPGTSWRLSVYNPRQDQVLKLRDGLLAMVVVLAFILSGLLLLLLLSSKRARILYTEQLETNKMLQNEKESREALLSRQFDLIACFESTKRTKDQDRSKSSDEEPNTLAKIASAKARISEVATRREEDIKVQELLAEGSFGKVYRGKWRCIDVAVKIIMLPGNMSGREKREKMIVWEAAISSSLVHPNVCQTYHYRIKPVKENARSVSDMASNTCVIVHSDQGCSRQNSGTTLSGQSGLPSPRATHSYEVQLILEYCDRFSLRDALDAGLFMTSNGINYAAQLDCAIDVAKAMLHLHCNNVLHLDLKTRNVLLASSGAEGKGVTCMVSDFGLSVRMDFSETHVSSLFQGTMTHMAPEVLLKGTCSYASDVYAFGIVLWELFTGDSPFRNVPPVLLGHSIVKDGRRPTWPAPVPKGYRDLTNACWDQNPDARPNFDSILGELQRLRKDLGTPTAPLQPYPEQQPQASRLPHLNLQPSLQLPSVDSNDCLHAKPPSVTRSEAARLEAAWLQSGKSVGAPKEAEEVPSVTPSQAVRLEAAWQQQPQEKAAPPEEAEDFPLVTQSQAARLEAAWQQLQGKGGTPSQECRLSASLEREEEDKTGHTKLVCEKAEHEGPRHPNQSKCFAGAKGHGPSFHSTAPPLPSTSSLALSAPSTTSDCLSLGPGAHSVRTSHDPHAGASSGSPCANIPLDCAKLSHRGHSADGREDKGEVQLVCGAEGGCDGVRSDQEVTASLWFPGGPKRADDGS